MKILKSKLLALLVSLFAAGPFLMNMTLFSTSAQAEVTVSEEDESIDDGSAEFEVVEEEDSSSNEESCEDVTTESLNVSRC